jgi:hypothetical protein
MYAYVDETGNTGGNIFDKDQPLFITGALITKDDYDKAYNSQIRKLASRFGLKSLHANELGEAKIDIVAPEILNIFINSRAQFFVSKVEKSFLLVAKLMDTLFDSYENRAVPWHVYNVRAMRVFMLFKLGSILTEDTAEIFWGSLLENNKNAAYKKLKSALVNIKECVHILPDERSRQLITEAIDWAIKNPEAIDIHINSKIIRNGHLPNMVSFPGLLRGIELVSKGWRRPVKEIIHDQQNQFEQSLREWHDLLSNASKQVIKWYEYKPFSLSCVGGSTFRITKSSSSVAIQSIDIVLWIFKRYLDKKPLGYNSLQLLQHVFKYGYQDDLSFDTANEYLTEFMEKLNAIPLTKETEIKAEEMLKIAEERRQKNMEEYYLSKKKDITP